jgi:hypothetical protein
VDRFGVVAHVECGRLGDSVDELVASGHASVG